MWDLPTRLYHWSLVGLVAVHVLAIVYHRLRKGEQLTRAMISGYRSLPVTTPPGHRASP